MSEKRVEIKSIVKHQLPAFVREDYPLIAEFLEEYYNSQEYQGSSHDLIQNIDRYLNVDSFSNLNDTTTLSQNVEFTDDVINVGSPNFTNGFPDQYGLIKINGEIILYQSKTLTTFNGCIRGFSGVSSLKSQEDPEEVVFEQTQVQEHTNGDIVYNLSNLFLKEFLSKIKIQIVPGFESRTLDENINQPSFIKRAKDFYQSKGTDEAFKILFKSLYGENVEIIKPKDFLISPSSAEYSVTKDIVVESIVGNPLDILNRTLYQDEYSNYNIGKAYSPITNIERIFYGGKEYYKLSLDFNYNKDINLEGSIFGTFSIHPKTKVTKSASLDQTVINVDSTVGFPNSGSLRTYDIDGNEVFINYTEKTLTQFRGVSGIINNIEIEQDIYLDVFAYSYSNIDNSLVTVRVTPVVSGFIENTKTKYFSKDDTIRVKSIGITTTNVCSNSFILNNIRAFIVESIENRGNDVYSITTYDDNNFSSGDDVRIKNSLSQEFDAKVISISSGKTFSIQYALQLNTSASYSVERKVNFTYTDDSDYQYINDYHSDVENVFLNKNQDVLVSSQGYPNYNDQPLKIKDKKYTISGFFDGLSSEVTLTPQSIDHGLYSGDSIYYSPYVIQDEVFDSTGSLVEERQISKFLNIEEGNYFVYRVDSTKIKIARSLSDLENSIFVFPEGNITNNTIQYYKFYDKNLDLQNIIRVIKSPDKMSSSVETLPGKVGILINGVEIVNYKSSDKVYYGDLTGIEVVNKGSGYDIINPPIVEIIDQKGSGASGVCNIKGSLSRIDIIDPGFDYVEEPIINISGGNGSGAVAKANLKKITHSVLFDATSSSLVGLNTVNTIGFSTYHKFRDTEKIVYKTDNQKAVVGLVTDSVYYASVVDSSTIKLYENLENLISGISTVILTGYGEGVHRFESFEKKNAISKINVISSGSGYENKKRVATSSGISTVSGYINIPSHGFSSLEKIVYSTEGSTIEGLTPQTQYLVKKIDDDNFRLCEIGVGNIDERFYYNNSLFINFTGSGTGNHIFNYPSIVVSVKGNIGVNTFTNQDFNAIVQPIFRGSVESIQITSGGQNYGTENILNQIRQPEINLKSGSGAELLPIISNGIIQEVLVLYGGVEYNSPPDLVISSQSGKYAQLTPILNGGQIIEVKVLNGGTGYSQGDKIHVISAGSESSFEINLRNWTVNLFEKQYNILEEDDGVIIDNNDSLEYVHLYAPRKLRTSIFGKTQDNLVKYGVADLSISDGGEEISSRYHSPIIGWSYDGYPIYGPYGFSEPDGGNVRLIRSSYKLSTKQNRPSFTNFPQGFFVEDYEYQEGFGDLDVHNGRFCITPDYPKGTYAYFTSIESINEQSSTFKKFRKPKFPYLIGNTYKSTPNEFNYLREANQSQFDFSTKEWVRDLTKNKPNSKNSYYQYFFNSNQYKETTIDIKSTTAGKIEGLEIVGGGDNYKVGDSIIFDNSGGGFGASAKVSKIKGKSVSSIGISTSVVQNIEFSPAPTGIRRFIGISSLPHNLSNNDNVTVSGLSILNTDLYGSYSIGVKTDIFELSVGIGSTQTTGITTSIKIIGDLRFPSLKINDILSIEDEKVKVLSIDRKSSSIRVLREYDSTVGVSHTASTILYQNPRYFTFDINNDSDYDYRFNSQVYFDPQNTVGLGTTSGVGISSTLFVGIVTYQSPIGIETGAQTVLWFRNNIDLSNYSGGGYVNITNSTNPSFDANKVKIVSVGTTSIKVDYDTSSLSGIGVTSYLDKWNIINIPTRSIYLPEHGIQTGETLIYSSNGDPISVSTEGTVSYQLTNNEIYYAVRLSDSLLGISTFRVGLDTSGEYVGFGTTASPLYFTSFGTGDIHSFKTLRENVVEGEVQKNIVTVSTASMHRLSVGDNVNVTVKSNLTNNIIVKYDDYNGRIVINPREFIAGSVDSFYDTIEISNHGLKTGDKVVHTSSSPSGGLTNNKIYYVVFFTKNKIRLATTLYNATKSIPEVVDITSASSGVISPINPPLQLIENSTVTFDLSDSSLSSLQGSTLYSSFNLKLYTDSDRTNEFLSSKTDQFFEVEKVGRPGIDASAYLSLRIRDSIPRKLYYKFDLINLEFANQQKLKFYFDEEVIGAGEIDIVESEYTTSTNVTGISSLTFTYNIQNAPERSSYTLENSSIEYDTTSSSADGPVFEIKLNSGGNNYKSLVGITSIRSLLGRGAIIEPTSDSIGGITTVRINEIGFDYPSDFTLKPITNLPEILVLSPLTSFDRIGISSAGKNYILQPDLIVKDGYTGELITDVDLRINQTSSEVEILKNTYGMNDTIPTIIPVANSNGIGISTISFDPNTKYVTVGLNTGFSDSFPFSIDQKVLIENISVGVGSTAKGYNSSNYNYDLFTVVDVTPNLGGIGSVTYSMNDFLVGNEYPGTYDPTTSLGTIVPESYFPTFDISLRKNNFIKGERIESNSSEGIVESWDDVLNIVKISSTDDLSVGSIIYGISSNTKAVIRKKIDFESECVVSESSIVENGWITNTGFLNDNLQRTPDNNYYQNFSYSIKSKVSYDDWNDSVSALNHTSGFKKFSDYVLETSSNNSQIVSGISSSVIITDIVREVDINCISDFDNVIETTLSSNSITFGDEVVFTNRILTDYFESVGNRVLTIDDFSDEFNSDPRFTKFSVVDEFVISQSRSRKYFVYISDRRFSLQREIIAVTLVHNGGGDGYINQYGRVETYQDLGSFDFRVSGDRGQLLFYPEKFEINDYNLSHIAYNIQDSISGVGTTTFGNIVEVSNFEQSTASGISTEIVAISSTSYRSAKVLVQIEEVSSENYEFDELTLIHDGTNIELLEYGQLNTSTVDELSVSGFGTYSAYYEGSDVKISFNPTNSFNYTINTVAISIANTSSTGVGTQYLAVQSGDLQLTIGGFESFYTNIASSGSPTENVVSQFTDDFSAAYLIASVEDLTTSEYQVSELMLVNDTSSVYLTEFGVLQTGSGLGTFGSNIVSGINEVYFTPNPGSEVEVRIFQNHLKLPSEDFNNPVLSIQNADISVGFGFYEGTFTDVRRQFNLTHNQQPIFQRVFDGGDAGIVSVTSSTIRIPDHFFVSGEQVSYTNIGSGTTNSIGIATTTITGYGSTDKLPQSVYVIKVDDSTIQFAESAEKALKTTPEFLELTSVGLGTFHQLTCENQNSRCLIAIDNYIQSPIVGTSITTVVGNLDVSIFDNAVTFSGITSFFSGDLIKINDEIMKINTVGFGSTNVVTVNRPWMGTGLSTHSSGDLITKISGNYNIVDNNIHFVDAPKGKNPIGTITNPPDSRDWTGITTYSSFQGRTFLRSGIPNNTTETYSRNYIFDDISSSFDAQTKEFTLQSNRNDLVGFSTGNAIVLVNDIFQAPQGIQGFEGDYSLSEISGATNITFTGTATSVAYDPNNSNIPVGGVIVSVGSSNGFAFQPLVAAGGTAIVSAAGTIQSISIGNSGSGYRSGIQTTVNVGVQTLSTGTPNIEFIGTASISGGHIVSIAITNPGVGYTHSSPPTVVFDEPLSYSNIPLIYSTSSPTGYGTEAKVDIVVGQGSSIIDFTIKNPGYGYGQNEILTVEIGGTTGIPTDTTKTYQEFSLQIDKVFNDKFSGWTVGDFEVLDNFNQLFDGSTRSFGLKLNGSPLTIRSAQGSNIDIQAVLLIFINDILQYPGDSYRFAGGSVITFAEAPKSGDTSKIIFYKGSGDIDVIFTDVLELVKEGDTIEIGENKDTCSDVTYQDERIVTEIYSSSSIKTNVYSGPGLTNNPQCTRPLTLCRQTEDRVINGQYVNKDRIIYEPLITPTTYGIQSVGLASTAIFVQSVKTFFDSDAENTTSVARNTIYIISQNSNVAAAATAVVSSAGTISSIIINDGGFGYESDPEVTISSPVGLGNTYRSAARSFTTSGIVTSILVTSPGTGYTYTNPPEVLIEIPKLKIEQNLTTSYEGDFGTIVGVKTTSVGVSTGIVFDLLIPENSYLRDSDIVGSAITVSQLASGYCFTAYNTNIGNGVTSLYSDGSVLGIGTQYLDNVYEVSSVSIAQTEAPGYGTTYVAQVTVSLSDYNSLSGTGYSSYFGDYSWGKILLGDRVDAKEFDVYTQNGIGGISTSLIVTRKTPLKYLNYL